MINVKKHLADTKQRIHFSTYGLVLFFLLLPFEYPLTEFGVGSVVRYVGIMVIGLSLIDILYERGKIYCDYRVILLLVWLIYAYFSVLWCLNVDQYSHFFSMYRNNALMFLFVVLVRYRKTEVEAVKYAFIAGIALLLLYMTFVPGAVTHSQFQNRLTLATRTGEELIDQNYLIAIMSMPFGFVVYDLLNKKRKIWIKLAETVFSATCLYYTFLTGARSGLIAFLAIILFSAFGALKRNAGTVLLIALVAVIVLPYAAGTLDSDVMERFSVESMTGQTHESGSRMRIWTAALNSLDGVELFYGYGAGNSMAVMDLQNGHSIAIHNYYIAQIVELGLIGFVLFTSLVAGMYMELMSKKNAVICISFIGIMVESVFLDILTTKFFWSAVMLVAMYITAEREAEKIQNLK